jgi:uncharacterized protein
VRRLLSSVSAGALGVALLAAPVLPASAASPNVVVSEVYGGGGNSGATYTHDFVTLLNRGDAAVSLDGWSVQYASATGSGDLGGTAGQLTPLPSVTLPPGASLLVEGAQGAGGTTPLPSPDVTDASPLSMGATGGKVAVVRQTDGLGCNGGSAPCTPEQEALVADLVGYGSANWHEGAAAAPAPSNTTSVQRAGGGCTDTDDNAADFTTGAPDPRNASSAPVTCEDDGDPGDPGDPEGEPARIHEIQGAGHRSPLAGDPVRDVPGVVTATSGNGFWFEDPEPDTEDATSEGLFVFTSSAPSVQVGDAVEVAGRVAEFRPGGAAENLTTTEITSPTVGVVASGEPLPETVVGDGGRVPPSTVVEDDATGDVETSGTFDPAADGLDFHESLEGMRVTVAEAVAVGPTNRFGEVPVVSGGAAGVRTPRGGVVLREDDANPERFLLDDALADTPTADVGDGLAPVTGVLDYSFGMTKLLVESTPAVTDGGLARETTDAAGAEQLAVSTFNVENLDAGDPQAKFDALAGLVVDHLASPDLLSLEEVQDDSGPTSDGTVDASATVARLTDAIEAAGGPAYEYRDVDPQHNQDGGEPGGNIRVGFLFRTDRGLAFVDRPGGDATTAVDVEPGPHLSASPARVDPTNPAFDDSRKPVAAEFTFRGRPLFVVANHFNSKGGDDPLFGRFQPPQRSSETQRLAQAEAVHGFVADVLAEDPSADVVVLGDLNDFPWSDAVETVQGDLLTNLVSGLPAAERYSYVFEGNSQALDHVLVSDHLVDHAAPAYDVVHVNAEFADQASDHDPSVARLSMPVYDVVGGGLGAPLDREPSVRRGAVVPVRVALAASDGTRPGDLAPEVSLTGPDGEEQVTSAAVDGTTMRFDAESQQYVYPLATRALSDAGRYTVTVTVPESGQEVTGTFTLRG